MTIEADDPAAAERFYTDAFDLGSLVRVRQAQEPSSGFRGFTMSLVVAQPANARELHNAALAAGAAEVKPPAKSMWGFGSSIQAPDGTVWTIATSSKKDSGPATRDVDEVVLLIGAADVGTSKKFYVEQGLTVSKSFGRTYVEFASHPIKLALNGRRALAKNAGVPAEGAGSHRLTIGARTGSFTDPDGFRWEASA
ncbi:hypothetical protein GCM10027416_29110 [Okibacterium endophyticum]